ncbi:ribosomal protein subunit L51-b [Schizosaccharomyces cryophilus OY26]|uniref:Ribosomal protein subunit L51-b n=1 Tax=Schizosaccharomyces cryophilus (strain OY26 / ATCC MYA-4695 / CBS 11777 / NBRC 106824 / NRRL Y48691) TaxID=653667 RepID=S9X0I9_SCHCR|nr:ribosomal protein subunit L51-b [Schizosaccharomyces cryophilus OY26]EPY50482.1 ribosomal protein subunit L51-b [Schizosaccharomyces cryophilus OY26]
MKFIDLFRNSRAVTLARILPEELSVKPENACFPSLQALTAKKSQRNRGDWGVKRKFPIFNTRYISVDQFDTPEHQCSFSACDRFVRTLKRIHDLNLPVTKRKVEDYDKFAQFFVPQSFPYSNAYLAQKPNLQRGALYANIQLLDSSSKQEATRSRKNTFISTKNVPLPFSYGRSTASSKELMFGVAGIITSSGTTKDLHPSDMSFYVQSLSADKNGRIIPNLIRKNKLLRADLF